MLGIRYQGIHDKGLTTLFTYNVYNFHQERKVSDLLILGSASKGKLSVFELSGRWNGLKMCVKFY